MDYLTWAINNWDVIISVITSMVTIASAVCAMTDTPKDDEFVAKWKVQLYKLLEIMALNINKAKK